MPDVKDAKALLEEVNLPTSDIDSEIIKNFVGYYVDGRLVALGGVEIYKEQALLRSLATTPAHQRKGLAHKIVSALEDLACRSGVFDLYLVTETAESYFSNRGYTRIDREAAPFSIANTTQFRELCPVSAVFMHKQFGT